MVILGREIELSAKKLLAIKLVGYLLGIVLMFIIACYISSIILLNLHGFAWTEARLFTAWEYYPIYKNSEIPYVKLTVITCAFLPIAAPLIIVPLILYLYKSKGRALHGDARFATLQEIRKAELVDLKDEQKTILVGKYKKGRTEKYLTYGGFQFVMVAAPTRSGKGVGIVIPNCLNYSDSLVVLDIKLENFDITSGYRAEHGQEVFLFAPFDVYEKEKKPGKSAPMRTHRYNPLGYISDDPADRMGDIDAIANAFYNNPNSKDKFFDEQAKDLFRGICLLVLEDPSLPKTLGEVFRQSSGCGKPLPEHLDEMLARCNHTDACRDAIKRVCTLSDNTFAGVKGSMQVPLMPWANPRVDAATSANDFDLRDVRKKRMTIYLGITPNKLAEAKNIINIFFDQLINLNTRTLPSQDPSLKYQCLMILDEFTAIGKVNQIAQSISYQAGYNMRVLTIIQNKSQLEDVYGKPGALTLMSNHALMVMYAPSPVVQSDANEYSEMLGYQTVESTSHSKSRGKNGSRSESTSDQKRALMLPQEIKELGRWKEIVSLENCKPIYCEKIKYFEDPAFTDRANHPIAQIPLVDIDAILHPENQQTYHEATEEDINDPHFIDRFQDANDLPDESELIQKIDSGVSEDQVCKYAGDKILGILKTKKIPVSKDALAATYGSQEQANEAVDDLFGEVAENSTVVNQQIEEQLKQPANQANQEIANAIAAFGFDTTEPQKISNEDNPQGKANLERQLGLKEGFIDDEISKDALEAINKAEQEKVLQPTPKLEEQAEKTFEKPVNNEFSDPNISPDEEKVIREALLNFGFDTTEPQKISDETDPKAIAEFEKQFGLKEGFVDEVFKQEANKKANSSTSSSTHPKVNTLKDDGSSVADKISQFSIQTN